MKKQVKFICAIAGERFSYRPGDLALLDKQTADNYIASGIAQSADEDPDDLKKQIAELNERLNKVQGKPAAK